MITCNGCAKSTSPDAIHEYNGVLLCENCYMNRFPHERQEVKSAWMKAFEEDEESSLDPERQNAS